ncbi:unnamed protein product, partial [Ixodes pacificus]
MAGYNQREFVQALKRNPEERLPQDLKLIYSYIHVLEALSSLKEANIRALCRTVRYERHDANDILYCRGELSTCWYILLSGSVFINGSMYLPRSRRYHVVREGVMTGAVTLSRAWLPRFACVSARLEKRMRQRKMAFFFSVCGPSSSWTSPSPLLLRLHACWQKFVRPAALLGWARASHIVFL